MQEQLAFSFEGAASADRPRPATAPARSQPLTAGALLDWIQADDELPPARRRDWCSRFRTLLRVTGSDEGILVDRRRLVVLLDRLNAGHRGLSPQTLYNIRSAVNGISEHYGLTRRKPDPRALSAAWREVRAAVPEPSWRGICALAYWADAAGIEPARVDQAGYEAFLDHLLTETLEKAPENKACTLVRTWNRIGDQHPQLALSRLEWTSRRQRVSRAWNDLPVPFADALVVYREAALRPSLSDPAALSRPLAPTTVHAHLEGFRRAASALLAAGFPEAALTGIDALCQERAFRLWVEAEHRRLGDGRTKALFNTVAALKAWAQRTGAVPPDQTALMRQTLDRLGRRKPALTEKNRGRLRAFEDVAVQRGWLAMSDRLLAKADRTANPRKRALLIQTALLHELLIAAPLRFGNVTCLDLDRHIHRDRRGRTLRLILPAAEVKNRRDLEFDLPPRVVALFDRYLAEARPVLCPDPACRFLWPGQKGGHKHEVSLAGQLRKAVQREVGVTVNPHLYRHLAGFFFLKVRPGEFETLRQLLGHQALSTTLAYYVEIDRMWASQQWGQTLDVLRQKAIGDGRRR